MTEFKFPMSVRERVMGIVYIAFHSFLIPQGLALLYVLVLQPGGVEISDARINLIVYLIGFLFCVIFINKFLRTSFSCIFDAPGKFLKTAAIGFGVYFALSMAVTVILAVIMGDIEELINPNNAAIDALSKEEWPTMAVMSVFLAPVVEETMFRGALFGTIRTKSRWAAYIVTVAVFSIYHLWPYFLTEYDPDLWLYLLQYVPASVVLCAVYEKSGTVWCSVLMHMAINAIGMAAVK